MTRPLRADGALVVADRPVPFDLPEFMHVVHDQVVGDLADHSALLGPYAQHFALSRSLGDRTGGGRPLPASLVLARPDRFAVVRPVGRVVGAEALVSPAEVAGLTEADLRPAPGVVVLPGVATVPAVLTADVGERRPRDLMRFLATAIDRRVAGGEEVALFLGHGKVVDIPTVGVYPTEWYLQTMTALEQVATAFLRDHPAEPTPALEFCLARLHALLLARLVGTLPDAVLLNHRPVVVRP